MNTSEDLIVAFTTMVKESHENLEDAKRWRDLQLGLARLGYGPLFSVEHILALLPNATIIASVAAASWPQEEPVSAPAAPKSDRTMPRRKLSHEDKEAIYRLHRNSYTAEQIAADLNVAKADLNVAKNSVEKYLHDLRA